MTSSFSLVTRTPHSAENLFDLSLDVDAHVGSMEGSRERAIAGVTAGPIALGESVTWRARHFGVWFRLTSTITALDRPRRFVDEQTRGPFRSFRHEHIFRETADGGAVMIDEITLASPVFGRLAERFVLVPYLRRLIAKRNAFLVAQLNSGSGS
ncbi:cyclase [Microbacterium sp. P06]|uniref:SRPBCC family protein n=1 Tax=unclassified Microbacterium TaxID=2609290 RepID=UPI003745574E